MQQEIQLGFYLRGYCLTIKYHSLSLRSQRRKLYVFYIGTFFHNFLFLNDQRSWYLLRQIKFQSLWKLADTDDDMVMADNLSSSIQDEVADNDEKNDHDKRGNAMQFLAGLSG